MKSTHYTVRVVLVGRVRTPAESRALGRLYAAAGGLRWSTREGALGAARHIVRDTVGRRLVMYVDVDRVTSERVATYAV